MRDPNQAPIEYWITMTYQVCCIIIGVLFLVWLLSKL